MRSLLAIAVLAIAACGPMARPANQPADGSDTAQTEMVCHDVSDTGSLMRHRECQPRTHAPSEDDRQDTENMLGKPRSQPTAHH